MKLIMFIISSCNFQHTLINDELVAKNFSAEEVIELGTLHDLVFDQICPNSEGNKRYSYGYYSWAKKTGKYIGKQASKNPDYYEIPELSNDKSVDFIHSLDSNIFKLIWRTTYTIPGIW